MLMSVIAHGDWADHADQMRDFLGVPIETHMGKHHADESDADDPNLNEASDINQAEAAILDGHGLSARREDKLPSEKKRGRHADKIRDRNRGFILHDARKDVARQQINQRREPARDSKIQKLPELVSIRLRLANSQNYTLSAISSPIRTLSEIPRSSG